MLVVHETHRISGRTEEEFEALFRDGWAPALGKDDDARLLWYLHQAHGTGPSYTVVTLTAVAGAAAWNDLCARVREGDLAPWATDVDALRQDHAAKVLAPVSWSPLQELALADVPAHPGEHDQALFMEDTAWPFQGKFADYLEKAGRQYAPALEAAEAAGRALLRLEAAFTPVWGTGRHREVVLWQRVMRPDFLPGLFGRDVPPEHRAPGTWMHDALEVRDRWESRLLRSTAWSPLA